MGWSASVLSDCSDQKIAQTGIKASLGAFCQVEPLTGGAPNGRSWPADSPDQPVDPSKDMRISGSFYGVTVSPADGSVFMLTGSSPIAVLPHVYKKLKYDPPHDFMPVTTVCTFSFMLSVGPLVPQRVKTLDDFIQWCRANPKLATYGTLGVGTAHHFIGFMLARAAGFELQRIPVIWKHILNA